MDILFPQILFQIINFGVVLGALTYLLYKPVIKILDERAQKIEEGQVAAEKALAEQNQAEEMKKKTKQQAEKEAAKILEEANKLATTKASKIQAKAKEEALAEVERLRQAWNEEKRKSLKDMQRQYADSVIASTEKVLAQKLDAKAHAKLIDESFTSLVKSI